MWGVGRLFTLCELFTLSDFGRLTTAPPARCGRAGGSSPALCQHTGLPTQGAEFPVRGVGRVGAQGGCLGLELPGGVEDSPLP